MHPGTEPSLKRLLNIQKKVSIPRELLKVFGKQLLMLSNKELIMKPSPYGHDEGEGK
jgi:hypothetical protein